MKLTKGQLKKIIREELAAAAASPLPNTRVVLRGSKGKKKGYWTSQDLHGDKDYVMVKWDGAKNQSRVEKHLLDTIKE